MRYFSQAYRKHTHKTRRGLSTAIQIRPTCTRKIALGSDWEAYMLDGLRADMTYKKKNLEKFAGVPRLLNKTHIGGAK